MRAFFARLALLILSLFWLVFGAVLLLPALAWFLLAVWPCLTGGASCAALTNTINQMFLFGRADLGQLQSALYWLGMLLVPLALAALFVGSRLFDHLTRRQSPGFMRVASVFGVMVATALLLLLTQTGLTESWLNWARTGCLENGVELCSASPTVPEAYRQYLVEQVLSLVGQLRLWGTVGGMLVWIFSVLLLWLPPIPAPAIRYQLLKKGPGIPPTCDRCGVRGEHRRDSQGRDILIPPTCAYCQRDTAVTVTAPTRRWRFWRTGAALLLLTFLSGKVAAQAEVTAAPDMTAQPELTATPEVTVQPEVTASPEVIIPARHPETFCQDPGVICAELFSDNTADEISNLRVNSLSDTSAQPVLEINFNLNPQIFTDTVKTVRFHLPPKTIPTITTPDSCELVIAALAPPNTTAPQVTAQPYVDITADQAALGVNFSLKAFAYCAKMNLPGSGRNNRGFPPANNTLYDEAHAARRGTVLPDIYNRLVIIFDRLWLGRCANAPDQAPLTFNHLGAQMAVFIAQEITGAEWQKAVWQQYQRLQAFTDNYAGIYCLLNQTPGLPLQANLSGFPKTEPVFRSGFSLPLLDASTGDILRRRLTITRDGAAVYADDQVPDVLPLDVPGEYTLTLTVDGPAYTYDGDQVIPNPPQEFLRRITVQASGGTPEPTPIGVLDLPGFSSQSLDLPLLDENTLTVNQVLSLTIVILVIVGVAWALLLRLPPPLRVVSLLLAAAGLIALIITLINRP